MTNSWYSIAPIRCERQSDPRASVGVRKRHISSSLCVWVAAWMSFAATEPAMGESPTFTKDVLPILQERCQTCHRPGQIAPMSFMDYPSVRPWAKAIRKAVRKRLMPPFAATGPIGYFQDDLRLSEEEITTLSAWVDGGTPRGAPQDAPPPVEWTSQIGRIADPDIILRFPSVTSEPNNQDHWVLIYSDHIFEEETWIESWELIATDKSLIHHSGSKAVDETFYVPDELILHGRVRDLMRLGRQMGENINYMTQNTSLGLWLPGTGIQHRPGSVFRIGPGERVVLQAHIAPTPEARTTDLSIALRLADGSLETGLAHTAIRFKTMKIPPGVPDYTLRGRQLIAEDGMLRSIRIHMHERGKSAKVILHYPNGNASTVLKIPRWDFDWQRMYHLAKPISVPAGTIMEAVAVWDNSENNPNNPDPNAVVTYGPLTSDEMFSAVAFLNYDRQTGPLIFDAGRLVSGDAQRERAIRVRTGKKKPGVKKKQSARPTEGAEGN